MTTADIAETTTCLRIISSTTTDILHLRGGECLYSLMDGKESDTVVQIDAMGGDFSRKRDHSTG